MTTQAHPPVTIYGGGIAGAVLAKRLSKQVKVTLVDPLDYFEVPMAAPRSLVSPDFAQASIIPFSAALPDVEHIQARLIELRPDGGLIEDTTGQQTLLTSPLAVLATGSRYANPLMRSTDGSMAERQAFYHRYHTRLAAAQKILLVGGGPIGVEVAGEIIENYPDKTLTLLDAAPRLLRGTSEAAALHAEEFLNQHGVRIVLNERLVKASSAPDEILGTAGHAQTSSGQLIDYDLIIWCSGGAPNTGYMYAHYKDLINTHGQIQVDSTLRVSGHPHLYALGDITDLDENKMAWHIEGQVKVAYANILTQLKQSSAPLKHYTPQTGNPMMALTLGSHAGVLQLPVIGTIRSAFLSRQAKAKHMLVPKYRKIFLP